MKIVYESSYKSRPVYGDTLMHWKYVKREKKNGRWVYTYDDSDTEYGKAKKKKQDYSVAKRNADWNKWDAEYKYTSGYERNLLKSKYDYSMANGDRAEAEKAKKESRKIVDNVNKTRIQAQKAGRAYAKANKEYKKIKVKTLAPRLIAKGAVKVANFLSKMFG